MLSIIGIIDHTFKNNHVHLFKTFEFNPFKIVYLFKNNEPIIFNKQFFFECDNHLCFCDAQIFNKQTLIKQLHLDPSFHDTALLHTLYKKFNTQAFLKCSGKWFFITYEKKSGCIHIYSDINGYTSIYYKLQNNMLYFTNRLFNMVDENTDLNINYLAGLSLGYTGTGEETPFLNIYRVKPAHYVEIDNRNKKIKPYFSFDSITKLHYKNQEDYYYHFDELFRSVINEYATGKKKIASTLSSGFDSTFVTSVLASELKKLNKTLLAITHRPGYNVSQNKNFNYDEGSLALSVSKKYSNISHIFDTSENVDIIESLIKSIEIHQTPLRNAINQYWIISLFEKLSHYNIDTLFIAQYGNITISWPFFYYKKSHKKALKALFNSIFKQHRSLLFQYNFLNNSLIKTDSFNKYIKNYNPYYYTINLTRLRKHYFNILNSTGLSSWNEKGNNYGINVLDPTADIRILQFCFSLPEKLFINNNESQLFIKEAAKNYLPEEILKNTKKGKQAGDIQDRLNQINKERINELFNHQNILSIFNIDYVLKNNLPSNIFLRILLITLYINIATKKMTNRII